MLFMQRVLVEIAKDAGLHAHVGDVFDLAFSPKERAEWAPPLVTIAHDNEWTDAELSARVYEMLVGYAPLRVAFVYPDMPPDDCAKRILAFAEKWPAPPTTEDIVLIGDPRGVHFRWPEWRLLRRDRGEALRDLGVRSSQELGACLCAKTLKAWSTPNYRLDDATEAEIRRGCDRKESRRVPAHHHFDESIEDHRYECRTCGASWKNRIFTHEMNPSDQRSYFSPWN